MSTHEKAADHTYDLVSPDDTDLGPNSAGQSGDTQGLSDLESSNSESVTELLEEGQYFEADAVSGIENVPDADVSEVHTHEVPEDDVPLEYLDPDDQADLHSNSAT